MNPRMALAVSAVLLFLVSELMSEGGPVDALASADGAEAKASAPAPKLAKAAPVPQAGSGDFFANYEPPESEDPLLAFDDPKGTLSRAPSLGAVSLGALTQEQLDKLGVERPSPGGVALAAL